MKALISGVAGQDGTYLAELLLEKGYEVHGCISSRESHDYKRHRHLLKDVKIHTLNITHTDELWDNISKNRYSEIYNLAGLSNVADSYHKPYSTFFTNTTSVINFLEAIRSESPDTKFYQASSSEIFEPTKNEPLDEDSLFNPKSPYAVSKLAAHWLVRNYREIYKIRCCSGLLFNHESPRRGGQFISRKVCDWVKSYSKGQHRGPLVVGNLNSQKDWGHSKDFVRAMWLMLNPNTNDDSKSCESGDFKEYIVGMGVFHSVQQMIEIAFDIIGRKIHWEKTGQLSVQYGKNNFEVDAIEGFSDENEKVVSMSSEFWRPAGQPIQANPARIKAELGWSPKYDMKSLLREMIESPTAST